MTKDIVVSSGKTSKEDIRLTKVLLKADKEARQIQAISQVGTALIGSPIVQVVGTVLACEILEKKEVISSGWSTGIEAGTIAMVGLHVLERYGVLGLGIAGSAGITGGVIGSAFDIGETSNKITEIANPGQGTSFPAALVGLIKLLGSRL